MGSVDRLPAIWEGEIFLSAGEFSGDLLAADLATELQSRLPRLKLFGITGSAMEQAGVERLASLASLNVMGVFEVAAKLADIRILEKMVLAGIDRRCPAAAILVDFPGFHFRLAEQLRLRGIPVIQYIAPKLWAWGASRAQRLKRDFAAVLGVFPFEREFFAKYQVPYTYVGSPHRDRVDKIQISRSDLGFPSDRKIISLLPGSRSSELRRLLPIFAQVKTRLQQQDPNLLFVLPLAPSLDERELRDSLSSELEWEAFNQDLRIVRGMSLEVMAVSDVCCLASGTATLECALLNTPMIVVYVMNELSYRIAAKKVTLAHVSLVNILAQKKVVNEYIQEFSLQDLVGEMQELLRNEEKRASMQQEFARLREGLSGKAAMHAAEHIVTALCPGPA